MMEEVRIRSDIRPGDLGQIIRRQGIIYAEEFQYSTYFEGYVAAGIGEFIKQYDPVRDRVWFCEHGNEIVGSVLLLHRPEQLAQLRFFYLEKAFRGQGLGRRLMDHFMVFLKSAGYRGAYLWTTHEQQEAVKLYLKYGFCLVEAFESTSFGKTLMEQRYELLL